MGKLPPLPTGQPGRLSSSGHSKPGNAPGVANPRSRTVHYAFWGQDVYRAILWTRGRALRLRSGSSTTPVFIHKRWRINASRILAARLSAPSQVRRFPRTNVGAIDDRNRQSHTRVLVCERSRCTGLKDSEPSRSPDRESVLMAGSCILFSWYNSM